MTGNKLQGDLEALMASVMVKSCFAASGNILNLFGKLKLLKIGSGGGGNGARYLMCF